MNDIIYAREIVNVLDFTKIVKQLLETNQESCPEIVLFGLEEKFHLSVSKPINLCLHSRVCGSDNFVLHYGIGTCNKVTAWLQDNVHSMPHKIITSKKVNHRFLHLVYVPTSFVYVAACADMNIRTFDNKFNALSSLELFHTVLDMIYCESIDAIVMSGAGFVQILELGQCLQDPPIVRGRITLTSVNNNKPWVFEVHMGAENNNILAVCHEAVFIITWKSIVNLTCSMVLENREPQSLSSIIEYPKQQVIITGSQGGVINASKIAKKKFICTGSFRGHTKTILQLFIHWNEPLLFSSSADGSIRIWSIDTFFEIYRFDVHEPIFNFKLIGVDSFLFTTSNAVTVSKLSLFYKLFSSIGSEALWISRASINGLPARIVYVGRDGAVRLVSPVHGKTITITFPIVGHELIDIVHDPRGNTNYAHLDNGDIMVFSTKTSPCSTIQLWTARTFEDRVCSIEAIDLECLPCDTQLYCPTMLLFGGHLSGYITLLKGENFHMTPMKAHNSSIVKVKARKDSIGAQAKNSGGHMISYSMENIIVIWNISIKVSHDNRRPHELVFAGLEQINLSDSPLDTILVGETFILFTEHHIIFHRLPNQIKQHSRIHYSQKDLLAQSKIQRHFGNLKQICCCESLQIIATIGKDQRVRIWDIENNFIKELSFNEDIEAICFGNDRGDLLVALQGNLYQVPVWNCLNQKYLRMLLEMKMKDDISERCVAFSPMLKFWYDRAWVSRIPIGQTNYFEIRIQPGNPSKEEICKLSITESAASNNKENEKKTREEFYLTCNSQYNQQSSKDLRASKSQRESCKNKKIIRVTLKDVDKVPTKSELSITDSTASKKKENEKKKREEFRLTCNSQYIQQSSNDVNASQIQTVSCKDKSNIRVTVEDVDALPAKTELSIAENAAAKKKENEKKEREDFHLTCNSQYNQKSPKDFNASQIQRESCENTSNIRVTVEDVDALPAKTELLITESTASKNKENEKKKREEFRLTCNSQYNQKSPKGFNASQIQTESCKDTNNIRVTVEDVDALPAKTELSIAENAAAKKKENEKKEREDFHLTCSSQYNQKSSNDFSVSQIQRESCKDTDTIQVFAEDMNELPTKEEYRRNNCGSSIAPFPRNDFEDKITPNSSSTEGSIAERKTHDYSVDRLPSVKFRPCIRDGFLPNSVIRNFIQPKTASNLLTIAKPSKEENFLNRFQKAILAMLSLLQKSKGNESQFKELETLEDYFEDSFIWNDHCSMQSLITSPDETSLRFYGKDRYLDNEKSAQDRIANSISEQKRPNEDMDVNAAIRQDQTKRRKGSSGRIKRKPSKVKSVITGSGADGMASIFNDYLTKEWFPRDEKLTIECIVPKILKRLDKSDIETTREIFALLVNVKKQLQYSTPVMNEALGTLRKLFKSEKAAIRHAAVKTAIELASAHHEAVISDLKNLLNDPVKVVIKEAKRGLEILAGITDFETPKSAANIESIIEDKNNASNGNETTKLTQTVANLQPCNGIGDECVSQKQLICTPAKESSDVCIATLKDNEQEGRAWRKQANNSSKKDFIEDMMSVAPLLAKKFKGIAISKSSLMSMKEKRTKNTKNSRKDSISQNLTSAKQAGINNQCSINNIVAVPDTSLLQVKARIDRHDSFQKTDISNTMSIKIKKTSTTSEALPESGKNSPSIAENTRASQKKETLYSSLLEISSYALLLMRTLGSRKGRSSDEHNTRFQIEHEEDFAVNNDILQSLSYCLNMLNNGNVEILHVARDVQKYLEMLKCRMKEDIAKNVLEECLDKINILSSKIKRKKMVNRRAEGVMKGGLLNTSMKKELIPDITGTRISQAENLSICSLKNAVISNNTNASVLSQHLVRESKLSTVTDTKKAGEKAQRHKSSLPFLVRQKMERKRRGFDKNERSLQRCKRTLPRGSRIETDLKKEPSQASYGDLSHFQKGSKARPDRASHEILSKLPPILSSMHPSTPPPSTVE